MGKDAKAGDSKRIWSDHDATQTGQAVCDNCGSDRFKIGVNGSKSMKIRCAGCENVVAWCWSDDSGNDLQRLVPHSLYTQADQ